MRWSCFINICKTFTILLFFKFKFFYTCICMQLCVDCIFSIILTHCKIKCKNNLLEKKGNNSLNRFKEMKLIWKVALTWLTRHQQMSCIQWHLIHCHQPRLAMGHRYWPMPSQNHSRFQKPNLKNVKVKIKLNDIV